jgi:hypothetical protein
VALGRSAWRASCKRSSATDSDSRLSVSMQESRANRKSAVIAKRQFS